jgi:hypothetical protein
MENGKNLKDFRGIFTTACELWREVRFKLDILRLFGGKKGYAVGNCGERRAKCVKWLPFNIL